MKVHIMVCVDLKPEDIGFEPERGALEDAGTIYLIEVTEDDLRVFYGEDDWTEDFEISEGSEWKRFFSLDEVENFVNGNEKLETGFYTIVALNDEFRTEPEMLEHQYHSSFKAAKASFTQLLKEWRWDEKANLPESEPDGQFKLVNTSNGWESDKRYAIEEDAEKVLKYNKQQYYSVPGRQNDIFCEIVIDAGAEWDYDFEQGQFRWFPKFACLEGATSG